MKFTKYGDLFNPTLGMTFTKYGDLINPTQSQEKPMQKYTKAWPFTFTGEVLSRDFPNWGKKKAQLATR